MMKKISLYMLFFLLFIACKKDKKPVVVYDITGNWTLSSYQTNFGTGVNASVAIYPCMGFNVLTFFRDSTAKQVYNGVDTCFITPTHGQHFGLPGRGPIPYAWKIKGNVVQLTPTTAGARVYGTLSTVNNSLHLTIKDTSVVGANTYYVTSVEIKQ